MEHIEDLHPFQNESLGDTTIARGGTTKALGDTTIAPGSITKAKKCTQPGKVGAFHPMERQRAFSCRFQHAAENNSKYSYFWVQLPFCRRNLQDKKNKDYNLVSKLQSLYGGGGGIRTLERLLTVTRFPVVYRSNRYDELRDL